MEYTDFPALPVQTHSAITILGARELMFCLHPLLSVAYRRSEGSSKDRCTILVRAI